MTLLKKAIKEILYVRGIKQPFKYLGEEEYKKLLNSKTRMNTKRAATLKKIARRLDIPASLLQRINRYERIDE